MSPFKSAQPSSGVGQHLPRSALAPTRCALSRTAYGAKRSTRVSCPSTRRTRILLRGRGWFLPLVDPVQPALLRRRLGHRAAVHRGQTPSSAAQEGRAAKAEPARRTHQEHAGRDRAHRVPRRIKSHRRQLDPQCRIHPDDLERRDVHDADSKHATFGR